MRNVVITGIGLIGPLGGRPEELYHRLSAGEQAPRSAMAGGSSLLCPWCSRAVDFDATSVVEDIKALRLMNRDAQLAVAAAARAVQDAGLNPLEGMSDRVALFGATGMTGLPAEEIASLVRHSAAPDGRLDLHRFGSITLKRVRPVLSFKILANMPICFVSIHLGLRGPNAVYTPWQGAGVQAIAAAARCVATGKADAALAGACDVRTHEFALLSLEQLGAMDAWADGGTGPIPAEGAVFVVLEEEQVARRRGARIHARLQGVCLAYGDAVGDRIPMADRLAGAPMPRPDFLVGARQDDPRVDALAALLEAGAGVGDLPRVDPIRQTGNLYAAAGAQQIALAAWLAGRKQQRVLAHCLGFGDVQATASLEGGAP